MFYEALGLEKRRELPIGEEAINIFMGVAGEPGPELELTYNFGPAVATGRAGLGRGLFRAGRCRASRSACVPRRVVRPGRGRPRDGARPGRGTRGGGFASPAGCQGGPGVEQVAVGELLDDRCLGADLGQTRSRAFVECLLAGLNTVEEPLLARAC